MLAGNQPLYHGSLQRARRWLAEFFIADEAAARAMVRELEDLAGQVIAVELPDISRSLAELDAVNGHRRLQRDGEP